MNLSCQEICLVQRPRDRARPGDFASRETALAVPVAGESLVEVHWLSIDPYLNERTIGNRVGAMVPLGGRMPGRGIGRVVGGGVAPDVWVQGDFGWCTHTVVPSASLVALPEGAHPRTWCLGALGLPGLTAWLSLHRAAQVKAGQTLLITSAAGTVGSIAVQFARPAGVKVVGMASGAAKCEWLRSMGCVAVDRLDPRGLGVALREALPDGLDAMLDHAGGDVLRESIRHARPHARIVLTGHVAAYGAQPGAIEADAILYQRLCVRGFLVHDHAAEFAVVRQRLAIEAAQGRLVQLETVYRGLAAAPAALDALLAGRGIGKHLVHVAAD